jgi:hypothetical protein
MNSSPSSIAVKETIYAKLTKKATNGLGGGDYRIVEVFDDSAAADVLMDLIKLNKNEESTDPDQPTFVNGSPATTDHLTLDKITPASIMPFLPVSETPSEDEGASNPYEIDATDDNSVGSHEMKRRAYHTYTKVKRYPDVSKFPPSSIVINPKIFEKHPIPVPAYLNNLPPVNINKELEGDGVTSGGKSLSESRKVYKIKKYPNIVRFPAVNMFSTERLFDKDVTKKPAPITPTVIHDLALKVKPMEGTLNGSASGVNDIDSPLSKKMRDGEAN